MSYISSTGTSMNLITDEGIKALAKLSNLAKLTLRDVKTVSCEVFKYFSKLKVVKFSDIKEVKEGIIHLLRLNEKIEEISIVGYKINEIFGIFKSTYNIMKERINNIPLLLRLVNYCIRITPKAFSKESATRLLFEIYEIHKDNVIKYDSPIYVTDCEDSFITACFNIHKLYCFG